MKRGDIKMRFLMWLFHLITDDDKAYLADTLDKEAREDGYRDPDYVWKNSLEVKRDKNNMPVRKK